MSKRTEPHSKNPSNPGKSRFLKPLSDPFGTYIVGVVPLWSETGESTGILILAANMHQYHKSIALTTLAPALSGLVLITVILLPRLSAEDRHS